MGKTASVLYCFFFIKKYVRIISMNKKSKLLALAIVSLGTCSALVFAMSSNMIDLTYASKNKPQSLDCSYYFDNSDYISIYDLNVDRLDNGSDISDAKTWGTVTCNYQQNSTYYTIIQSTNKDGKVAATCLYNVGQEYSVGSVLSVTGLMTIYNGMSEMKFCSITPDYETNPYPVETWDIDWLPTSNDPELNEYRYMGIREVSLSNVSFSSPSNGQCYATLPNSNQIQLYFRYISEQDAITNKISSIRSNNSTAVVKGYMCYYTGGNKYQLYVRHADDIEEVVADKTVDHIEATTDKTFYYKDNISISDFTVTAYYDDNTSEVVNNAYIYANADTSTLGNQTIDIALNSGSSTFHYNIDIEVVDTIIALYVNDPVQYYTQNEPFITPQVVGESCGVFNDVTGSVTFSGFDSYHQEGTIYNSYVQIDYVNSAEKNLHTAYEYHVSDVESLEYPDAKFVYGLNEEFDYPTVYATFAANPSLSFDVTNRISFSGFDSSAVGDCEITITFGSFSSSYLVEIVNEAYIESLELVNCKTEYYLGEEFVKPTVIAHCDDGSSKDVTDKVTFEPHLDVGAGKSFVLYSYSDGHYSCNSYYFVYISPVGCLSLTIDSTSISWPTGNNYHSNGNYFTSGNFDLYNAIKATDNAFKLLPKAETYTETLGGSFYNINPIEGIEYIYFEYFTNTNQSSKLPKIYYGENSYDEHNQEIEPYYGSIPCYITTGGANYFRIDSGDTQLTIKEMIIYYTNLSSDSTFVYKDANEGEYRIAPTTWGDSTLVDGVSYVDVPVEFDVSTSTVTKTKRYTYYSYQYVSAHPEVKSEATMTSPVDVSNYFLAFGCAPANYGTGNNTVNPLKDGLSLPSKSQVSALFGSNARVIQQFSRTNGYATSVPYYGNTPLYYELDIAIDSSYSVNSRQIARVVAWSSGFNVYEYGFGSQAVCLYTDDHYSTFMEYNNYGGFMPRFSAESRIAGARWSNPTTLNVASVEDPLSGATLLDYSNCDFFKYGIARNSSLSSMHLYQLESGNLYIKELDLTITAEHVSGNRYFLATGSNNTGTYVDISNGVVTDASFDLEADLISGDYKIEVTVAGDLFGTYEYAVSVITALGYVEADDNEPEHYEGSDYELYYKQFLNSDSTVSVYVAAVGQSGETAIQFEIYLYDASAGSTLPAEDPVPELITSTANEIANSLGSSAEIESDTYQDYECYIVFEDYSGGSSSSAQEKVVASFTLGDGMVKMTFEYNSVTYEIYLGYEIDGDDYIVHTPNDETYRLSIVDDSLVVLKVE